MMRRWARRQLEQRVPVEIIGQEECPMFLRWEFLKLGKAPFLKAMVHYFPAETTDRDPHDHPRSFITFVLRGRYIDTSWEKVELPDQEYMQTIELVEAGQVIYRPARHTHIVETAEVGCWTIVVMGPEIREWGFLRISASKYTSHRWMPWKKYVDRYGGTVRCDT